MDALDLNATIRTATGNSPARALRREGKIPAILYGPDTKPVSIAVDRMELDNLVKKNPVSRLLLDLKIAGDTHQSRQAMVKELQTHPLSGQILHADFYEISGKRKIRVQVPVVAHGKCLGVEKGGMLQIIRRKLEVYCLPTQIPESIDIEVTHLDVGDVVHVNDIVPPPDVEIPAEVNFTVITVIGSRTAETSEEAETGEMEEPAAEEAATGASS